MAEDYTVKEGDCIASLAYDRGLLWQTVWNHPLNALLKTQRQDPNVLKPGDIVHLPDKQLKTVDKPTDQRQSDDLREAARCESELRHSPRPLMESMREFRRDRHWYRRF